MLNWAKNDNSLIQYEDNDYHNADGKLDGDNDKIIFNICRVKYFHILYFFSFAFLENIKRLKHENWENNNANYVTQNILNYLLVLILFLNFRQINLLLIFFFTQEIRPIADLLLVQNFYPLVVSFTLPSAQVYVCVCVCIHISSVSKYIV